jgi:hypothetical protein
MHLRVPLKRGIRFFFQLSDYRLFVQGQLWSWLVSHVVCLTPHLSLFAPCPQCSCEADSHSAVQEISYYDGTGMSLAVLTKPFIAPDSGIRVICVYPSSICLLPDSSRRTNFVGLHYLAHSLAFHRCRKYVLT